MEGLQCTDPMHLQPKPDIDCRVSNIDNTEPSSTFYSSQMQSSDLVFQKGGHVGALRRLLFIFAKQNPAIGYTQGMNEILAPLFFVLSKVRI